MTRAKGWKILAVASSIALAAAFVAYRVASARPEAGTPPANPAATTPNPTAKPEEPAPAWFGGSKSMILVGPDGKPGPEATYTLPTPEPAPQAPAK